MTFILVFQLFCGPHRDFSDQCKFYDLSPTQKGLTDRNRKAHKCPGVIPCKKGSEDRAPANPALSGKGAQREDSFSGSIVGLMSKRRVRGPSHTSRGTRVGGNLKGCTSVWSPTSRHRQVMWEACKSSEVESVREEMWTLVFEEHLRQGS